MSEFKYIPLEQLKISPFNARLQSSTVEDILKAEEEEIEKLKEDIKRRGLIQPLVVRPAPDGGYEVVAGFRRLEAIKRLRVEDPQRFNELFPHGVPVIVREMSDEEALLVSLSENIRQRSMTKEQLGAALDRALRMGISMEKLAEDLVMDTRILGEFVEFWWTVQRLREVPTKKPGRPKAEKKEKKVSSLSVVVADRLASSLKRKGVIEDEEKFAKRFVNVVKQRGLSGKEVQLLAMRLRREPEKVHELERLADEIENNVERIVLLRRDIARKISVLAKKRKKSFDEMLNYLLEIAIKSLEAQEK